MFWRNRWKGGSGETQGLPVHSEVWALRYHCRVIRRVLQGLELLLILNKEVFVDRFQRFLRLWAALLVQAGIDILEGVSVCPFELSNVDLCHFRNGFAHHDIQALLSITEWILFLRDEIGRDVKIYVSHADIWWLCSFCSLRALWKTIIIIVSSLIFNHGSC